MGDFSDGIVLPGLTHWTTVDFFEEFGDSGDVVILMEILLASHSEILAKFGDNSAVSNFFGECGALVGLLVDVCSLVDDELVFMVHCVDVSVGVFDDGDRELSTVVRAPRDLSAM